MNKLIIAFLFTLTLTQSNAIADGPPVNNDGTITAQHVSFKMTLEQIREAGRKRVVTLTNIQHQKLSKYYKNIPKRFVVVTPQFNDCTCDLVYIIWNKADTLSIPTDSMGYFKTLLEDDTSYKYNNLIEEWNLNKIIIDSKGEPYFQGIHIDNQKIETILSDIDNKNDKYNRQIAVSLPPFISKQIESKIHTLTTMIKGIAEKYNVEIFIGE